MATALEQVGSIYEVGIEGVGYMLSDSPARPIRRSTGILDTQPPGSDSPLSDRIGRYDFVASTDWTGGEGQEMANRPASDPTRYDVSEGVDPFHTPGQLTCLPEPANVRTVTTDLTNDSFNPGLVGAGPTFYVQTGTDNLRKNNTGSAFSTGLAGDISGLAWDGEYWYATDDASVRRNNTNADPGADWSTTNVVEIAWCGDRLVGNTGFNAGAPTVYEFSPAGVATAIPGAHQTNVLMSGLCGGGGYVWYGAFAAGNILGRIYFWQRDSSPTNAGVAFDLPDDEVPCGLLYYLGNVFVATGKVAYPGSVSAIVANRIYRCIHNGDGTLTPQLVCELPLGYRRIWFAGSGKYVAFSSDAGSGVPGGVGIIDLETGGFVRYWAEAGLGGAWTDGKAHGVIVFDNGIAWRVDTTTGTGGGVWWIPDADSDVIDTTTKMTGTLETSISDLATPALKHLDEILVSTLPLPAGTSVAVSYSTDGGATYTAAATFDTDGDTQHSVELATAVVAASFKLKLTLTPSGDDTPTVTALLAKTHATGITDQIIELPVNCLDTIAGVHGTVIAEDSGPGKGMERLRALEALIGTKILFQDVDWKTTQQTSLCEVVGVESTSVNVFNQNRNVSDVTGHVAVVQLRRPYT